MSSSSEMSLLAECLGFISFQVEYTLGSDIWSDKTQRHRRCNLELLKSIFHLISPLLDAQFPIWNPRKWQINLSPSQDTKGA